MKKLVNIILGVFTAIRKGIMRVLVRLLNTYASLLFVTCFLSWHLLFYDAGTPWAIIQTIYVTCFEPLCMLIRPLLPNQGLLPIPIGVGQGFFIDLAPIPLSLFIGYVARFFEKFS